MTHDVLLTSEAVAPGHPAKLRNRISDALLDACLKQDARSRVANVAAIKAHRLFVLGELSTTADIDPAAIARRVLAATGYDEPRWGLGLRRPTDDKTACHGDAAPEMAWARPLANFVARVAE